MLETFRDQIRNVLIKGIQIMHRIPRRRPYLYDRRFPDQGLDEDRPKRIWFEPLPKGISSQGDGGSLQLELFPDPLYLLDKYPGQRYNARLWSQRSGVQTPPFGTLFLDFHLIVIYFRWWTKLVDDHSAKSNASLSFLVGYCPCEDSRDTPTGRFRGTF